MDFCNNICYLSTYYLNGKDNRHFQFLTFGAGLKHLLNLSV